jgi:hypothetical protein
VANPATNAGESVEQSTGRADCGAWRANQASREWPIHIANVKLEPERL